MSEEQEKPPIPERRSASAEAAALKWAEAHPDDAVEPPPAPPSPATGEGDAGEDRPLRKSASAEAAALRWMEQQEESDG
jgi:hypothetical protein